MNYKHSYHAGGFSDVFKHIVLIALIECLKRKETPFCYIDTHAGIGCYDLFSERTAKTKEYEGGIEKIIQKDNPPALIQKYLDCVHAINNKLSHSQFSSLQYYPGSPLVAKYFSRPHDRVIACELHPEEYQSLRNFFAGDKQVATHHMDGFLGLKAFLPPKEKRGLVLIDPPYESVDEFDRIAQALQPSLHRFNQGVYAIWYPIKDKNSVHKFYRSLQQNIKNDIFAAELTIYPELTNHLNGCGLAIINPPYQFDLLINDFLPWLWKALTINDQGGFHAQTLK